MNTKSFKKYPEIKLVYLFGSRAEGKAGPMSDYDFAIYFDEKILPLERSETKINLITDLMGEFKTNNIDVVSLNDNLQPLLKYHVVRYGKLIYEKKPYRLILEPDVYSNFFDYQTFSKYHNL
ncbi:hypothetical protein CO165_03540 [Candidatus Roizmanbacteria bacterium CG_4_9_14_3_um_filter_33_18]|uniref:Polymerase beta nucleotidyltransferase domain-containing protein n=3 Tax=Candidatus Roizmaniibacteriota TaxID=1752723 RepID=A0A2M7XXI2_9BACT|nr:MAG: hypothetical protein COT02_05135 [Candidatus Roizmanbacteria bacterium CG07_land_8_20_14_0_80_34_15]PJA55438.1 MAG: hypothetical protein CO165_03540 [Candidatus Roizmanbacteria bacterium CG_4_9_14_3_um_filter_33_18]